MFPRLHQPGSHSNKEPEELNESDDADPNAKSKQASDCWEEVDPGLTRVCHELHHSRGLEVDLEKPILKTIFCSIGDIMIV